MNDEKHLQSEPSEKDLTGLHGSEGTHLVGAGYLHIGPLPDPATLRKYQEISPQLMDSIVDAFTSQGAHRKSIEKWIYKGGTIRSILGVIFAFIMGMTAIICGYLLVQSNHAVAGTIFGGIGIAGIIRSFLGGTKIARQSQLDDDDAD